MKKILISIFTAFCFLIPVHSFDFGGLIDDSFTANFASSFSGSNSTSAYLWGSSDLNKDGSLYIKGEVMYKLTALLPNGQVSHIFDADLLKLAGNFKKGKANFSFSAGRFPITDMTAVVFNQTSDGAYFSYSGPKFGFNAYAGFTGFINGNVVTMLGPKGSFLTPKTKVYSLSNPYIPVSLGISLPGLFKNQTLSVQANAFIDATANQYNRIYIATSLSGPLTSKVFYTVLTDFGTENFTNIMNYSSANVTIFPMSGMFISTGVEYASGNNGFLSPFRTVTARTAFNASRDVQTSGVLIPSGTVNYAVTKDLLLNADLKIPFTCDTNFEATGFQGGISCIFNIFSDLSLTASFTGFKGFQTTDLDKITASIKVALSI